MTTAKMTARAERSLWTSAVSEMLEAWQRYRVFRRTYDELNALTTRDLTDLGISRSMITRLAHEAAYGKKA